MRLVQSAPAPPSPIADRFAIAAAAARGLTRWRNAEDRRRSRAAIDAIAGQVRGRDALALSHLAESEAREAFIHRPWMAAGIPLTGADELRAALCGGRGVLASYCHLGPFAGIGVTIAEHAGDVHQVIGPWLLEPQRGPAERRRRAWLSMFDAAGVPMIVATGCFPAVLERLRSGAVVVMAFDWPGSTETMFLGRPAMLVSGTARLAVEADALVVPVARSFRGLRLRTVAGPPLDPRRHSGWRDLHAALAARHGRWILERPGALEDPRRPGAWGATAGSDRWGAPSGA